MQDMIVGLWVLAGIVAFLIVEKFIRVAERRSWTQSRSATNKGEEAKIIVGKLADEDISSGVRTMMPKAKQQQGIPFSATGLALHPVDNTRTDSFFSFFFSNVVVALRDSDSPPWYTSLLKESNDQSQSQAILQCDLLILCSS